MQTTFFLVKVFDQPPSSFLHLCQPTLKSEPIGGLLAVDNLVRVGPSVLRMPYIVSDELFKSYFPMIVNPFF